jgi:hypothetical protein
MSRWTHRLRELTALDVGKRVFGACLGVEGWGHGYRSRQVSESDLAAFESWCGCQLPASYRQYLLEVGMGPGPYYGLMPFHLIREELSIIYDDYVQETGAHEKPGGEFALERELTSLKASDTEGRSDFDAPHSSGGFMPICYQGCEYVTVMVTSGSFAGRVFTTTDFANSWSTWSPARRPPGVGVSQRPRTVLPAFPAWPNFEEWVNGWLEQCLADLRADPAAA